MRHVWICLVLAGCMVGPDYKRPDAPVPPAFKELAGWKISQPSDSLDKGVWWSVYHDAGAGALVALWIAGDDIDVIAVIGIILLIGIVKKNAIMIIDFALAAEREDGKSPQEAIHQACLLCFRPIMTTTMAVLPLVPGTGTGSELRRPPGVAIGGGLLVSQVLTLFTTPVIYLMFDRLAWRLRGQKPPAELAPGAPPP